MSRWLFLSSCLLVLTAIAYAAEPTRSPDAKDLGSTCAATRDCQVGLQCSEITGVMQAQCSASCNATSSCQERFGAASICLGADVCARTCEQASDCPAATLCNPYGWCERSNSSEP